MTTYNFTKGLIGKEDLKLMDTELYPSDQFSRTGQLGTSTLYKVPDIYKTHYPIINALYWNSASKNDTTITQALSYIGASNRSLYLETGAWAISNDLTIPANVELIVGFGATLTVASGKTLTINGQISAPCKQIFSGSGTVAINSQQLRFDNTWKGNANDCLYLYNEGLAADVNAIADGDTTPSVADGFIFQTANTGSTTITSFDDGITGQTIHVMFSDANTVLNFSSGNLRGYSATTWTANQYGSLVAKYDGTYWYCVVSSGGALLDSTNSFTASQKLYGDALLWRFKDTGSGGAEWGIRSEGGRLEFCLNTGTEVSPTWTAKLNDLLNMTAAGDIIYGGASALPTLLAKGAANTKLFMHASDAKPEWAVGIHVMTGSYTADTKTGAWSQTGVGFKPSWCAIFANVDSSSASWGFVTAVTQAAVFNSVGAGANSFTATVQPWYLNIIGGQTYGTFTSFDTDGATWSVTKSSSPTGTAKFLFIFGR